MSAHSYRQYVFFLSADRNEVSHLMSLLQVVLVDELQGLLVGIELLCELSLDDEHRHHEHLLSCASQRDVAGTSSHRVPEWPVNRKR